MRQSPRLAPPHAGTRAEPARGPPTPHHGRAGNALDELIRSLEAECNLGLQVRDHTWSPHKQQQTGSLADKVQGKIKRLFYSSKPTLDRTLDEFKRKAKQLPLRQKRLELLNDLLLNQTASPNPGRVMTRSQTLREETNKSLRDPPSGQTASSPRVFQILRNDTPDPMYTTAPELGSPTDDEGDWSSPPSPSASIKSTPRRGQGSDTGSSPKLAKTSKGTRPFESSRNPATITFQEGDKPSMFKKPALPAARSFQAVSAQTSFRTSFGSNTVWSSQQSNTQPDTALTSFNSEFGDISSSSQKITRTSSTTMGSLNDGDLYEATRKLEEEAARRSDGLTRESSTTYGSIDEDDLVRVSIGYGETARQDAQEDVIESLPPSVTTRTSPQKGFPRPIDETPVQESPTKIPHHIRDIPKQHLFVSGDMAENLKKFPYFIVFICFRIATEHNVPLQDLMAGMDPDLVHSDPEAFWAALRSHPKVPASISGQESKKVWLAASQEFDGYTFKAKVVFNDHRLQPVFSLQVLPMQADKSCRFQRAFGTDRFLYLIFPSFELTKKPSRFTNDQMPRIQEQWIEWFDREHSFLGRKWRAFHAEPAKRGKGSRKDDGPSEGFRVVMFATEGFGITKPCSVGELLNWFFPFADNPDQGFCKAFARIDLGLSRTIPTLVFKPSQIRYTADIKADGMPEDTRFDDPTLRCGKIEDKPVMNDGCSLISVGAAQEIWREFKKKTGINERMPTVFQARIGGSKGLWIVSSESGNSGPPPIWIELSKSQRKFQPHADDYFDESYDPFRTTFELVNYSTSPTPSDLHLSFIPIMVDRGVPKEAIEKMMRKTLDLEREQLLELVHSPEGIYDWVHKQSAGTKDTEDIIWQAALPSLLPDRIKLLLESGFCPTEEPYLGALLTRFIKQDHLWEEQKLRIPLGKSAFLYGIADPYGILAPGEIQVQFSTWFHDEASDESWLCLDDMDVLVARQPACRRSDLQKVRVVSHPKVAHLVDVVVFPSKGQYPLAGKLQGGDYDGDIFWTCWEPELVEPFKNAPAPMDSLDPAQYGIRQFKDKLPDVMNPQDLSTVPNFLKQAVQFRIGSSLLGKVTNYLEKQAYAENKVYSHKLDALCDMHDLLVDAPKQGYAFTDKEFEVAKRKLGLPRQPGIPKYKEAMDAATNAKEMGDAQKLREKKWKFNKHNVIDYLYFSVVRAHHLETQILVGELLNKTINDDPDLQYTYMYERDKGTLSIKLELDRLVNSFDAIIKKWNHTLNQDGGADADQYNEAVAKCYKMYCELMPENTGLQEIAAWVEPYLHANFTKWDALRASALYFKFPKKAAFVYHMAGKELADLKCPPSRKSRRVVGPIYSIFTPKVSKVSKQLEDTDSDDDEFATPLEEVGASP